MHAQRQPTFRADVQGLRAIAVLTVIAGHAGVPFLPGGFVGVDVFFVISGFLISQLLFREVERSGNLSIRDFYARRARRILPAATLVTIATVVASLLWLSVVEALDVITDAVWVTFFAANIHFAAVGTDYFAQEEGPSPLQHYWSLSVEEQFYLVWPLILLGCVWLARRRGSRGARVEKQSLPRLTVFWVLTGLGLASLVSASGSPRWTRWRRTSRPRPGPGSWPSAPSRRWSPTVASRLGSVQRGALAVVGLVAIAFACGWYDSGTAFPGWAAVVPVVGSALLLLAGAGGHDASRSRSGRCLCRRCGSSATGPTRCTSGTGRC